MLGHFLAHQEIGNAGASGSNELGTAVNTSVGMRRLTPCGDEETFMCCMHVGGSFSQGAYSVDTPDAPSREGGAVAADTVYSGVERRSRLLWPNLGNQASDRKRGRTLERCRTVAVCFRQSSDRGFNVFEGLLYPSEGGQVIGVLGQVN